MGSQQNTSSSNTSNATFNPTSLNAYNSLIGSGSNVLNSYMNNPFGNSMYTFGQQQTQKGAQQLGQQNMATLLQNQKISGLTGKAGAGWLASQQAQTGRANQAMRSQGNISNIMAALQRQMGAAGLGMSFSPLMTGQSSTGQSSTSTGGLGTWLPQALGAGLGIASMFSGAGAAGGLASMMGGGGSGPSYATPTSILPQGFAGASVGNSPFGMPLSGNTLNFGGTNPLMAAMMGNPNTISATNPYAPQAGGSA
jgi:hypothetical protein